MVGLRLPETSLSFARRMAERLRSQIKHGVTGQLLDCFHDPSNNEDDCYFQALLLVCASIYHLSKYVKMSDNKMALWQAYDAESKISVLDAAVTAPQYGVESLEQLIFALNLIR